MHTALLTPHNMKAIFVSFHITLGSIIDISTMVPYASCLMQRQGNTPIFTPPPPFQSNSYSKRSRVPSVARWPGGAGGAVAPPAGLKKGAPK